MRFRLICIALLLAIAAAATAQQPTIPAAFTEELADDDTSDKSTLLILYALNRNSIATPAAQQAFLQAATSSRNDMHLTASSSTPGSVALAEKTAIADIFAIAIERGAVNKEVNGTAVTLTTTPYAVATLFGAKDTPANWQALRPLRRIGVITTFASDAVVKQGDFSNFLAGGVKLMLIGTRSPRDAELIGNVAARLRKEGSLDERVAANIACSKVIDSQWGRTTLNPATTKYSDWFSQHTSASQDARVAKLAEVLPTVEIDADTMMLMTTCAASEGKLLDAETADLTLLANSTADYLARNSKHQLSLTTLFQRDVSPAAKDYLTVKLLYGNDLLPTFRTNLNAQVDFNSDTKLQTVRSFAAEASLTVGPFGGNRITGDFAGKYYRQQNEQVSTVVTQGTLNLRLTGNVQFPVGLSYATKAVDNVQQGFQVQLGVAVLLDQLLANQSVR